MGYTSYADSSIQQIERLAVMKTRRIIPATLILGYISIFASCFFFGWEKTWKFLLIPTMSPPFADMRTVQGSLYSVSMGLDPQIVNPGDPWGRVMNYPSIWISVADYLNFQSEFNYLTFVSFQIALFLLCLSMLARANPSTTMLLLSFSASTLLCVERGNNDLLVFSLVFLALRYKGIAAVLLISLATLMKIYPVFALPAFVRQRKVFIPMLIGCLSCLVLLLAELVKIRNGTPVSYGLSYGSRSISNALEQEIRIDLPAIAISICLIIVALLVCHFRVFHSLLKFKNLERSDEELFIAGGSVYVFTFLIGSNFDYRLIFLLLCVPMVLKLEKKILIFFLIFCLLVAFNFGPLNLVFGKFGSLINFAAKVFLLISILAILLRMTLKSSKDLLLGMAGNRKEQKLWSLAIYKSILSSIFLNVRPID